MKVDQRYWVDWLNYPQNCRWFPNWISSLLSLYTDKTLIQWLIFINQWIRTFPFRYQKCSSLYGKSSYKFITSIDLDRIRNDFQTITYYFQIILFKCNHLWLSKCVNINTTYTCLKFKYFLNIVWYIKLTTYKYFWQKYDWYNHNVYPMNWIYFAESFLSLS